MIVPDKDQRRDSQALFEKLFAFSPDAIVVVDREGRILEANPQVESLFGYDCSKLLGSLVEVLIPDRFRSVHAKHRSAYSDQPRMRPMGTGLELCGRRRDGSEFPVDIMLSAVETTESRLVLAVIRDITERKRLEEKMLQLALSDPLTGLGNYRRLEDAFETETKWFQRTGRSATLLLLDLDGLKKINDTYGHIVGSRALCRLAEVLRAECRSVDTATRHGGDEFTIILPDTNGEGARGLAHRLATRLANEGGDPPVSFSYGVGVYPHDGKTLHQLLAVADRLLYKMKKSES
jgi:diguanylate cyclase (GGDEF)-like protein/PAS domain S-box-containing protein